jgi:hypothetical protein
VVDVRGWKWSEALRRRAKARETEPVPQQPDIADDLAARVRPAAPLEIKSLTPAARDRYSVAWQAVCAQFPSDPATAVRAADRLVASVLAERGYPVDEIFTSDEPDAIERFRSAQSLWWDDLARALAEYDALLDALLAPSDDPATRRPPRPSDEIDLEGRSRVTRRSPPG